MTGSSAPTRRMRTRPPISLALIGLVTLLTAGTGAMLGAVAWREKLAGSRALVDNAMQQAARMTADHAGQFLRHAETAVRLGPSLVARGLLAPDDFRALGDYALGVLRADPRMSWISYGDRTDRFVGAWRDGAGHVYLNRSFPRGGRIRLEEDRVLADGRRERVRTVDDHGYRPQEQAFFRVAETRRGRGVDRALPLLRRARSGSPARCRCSMRPAPSAGVFTVDLSLTGLSRFVGDLRISPRGRVFIATGEGRLVAAPGGVGARGRPRPRTRSSSAKPSVVAARRRAARATPSRGPVSGTSAGRRSSRGRPAWVTAVVVPERDYTAAIDAQAWQAAAWRSWRSLLAIGGGIALVRWIAQPLRELGAQARRIREGDLDVAIVPRSRDEIGTLARTMAEMVQGLRDRDFIRDVLGRYVSPELAEQCVQDKNALRLGGEIRTVSIVMSDLRGFSGLSERLGPERMIGLLNRYLGTMTPVILGHRGTINEFIGDAILVLFGAPSSGPTTPSGRSGARGRCSARWRGSTRRAAPRVCRSSSMGIAVHSGRVVAGNIGSQDRMKYGVVGPAVNLAGRIES